MREKILFSDLTTLYVCPSSNWGTIERRALGDCLIQRDFGGNPMIFCLKDSKLDEEAKKWDIKTIYYTGKKVSKLLDFRYFFNLRAIFKQFNFDVVHCYNLDFIWEICFLLFTKPKIPLLFTFNQYLEKPQKDFIQKWLFRRVDQVLVFSQTMREVVQDALPVSNRRIKISGNGVENIKKVPREDMLLRNINCMVTSPTDLEQVRTLIYSMKALKYSVEDLGLKIKLNVYSMTSIEKFDEYESTIQLGHDNQVSDIVHFEKVIHESDIFKNADIFVGTAFDEPFNDYEMMAIVSKIPVLLPRTASRQFILNKHKWTGESYYFSDPREVKSKLLKILINDQVYLNELDQQNQSFMNNHGIDSYINRLCGFYERNYSKRLRFAKREAS